MGLRLDPNNPILPNPQRNLVKKQWDSARWLTDGVSEAASNDAA